ncbi:MAG: DNA translocase FtsK [Dehalococcoidia bacterium]|nr:MAG: DNA translocase FtsK [Dehalococcoidia bacterium]
MARKRASADRQPRRQPRSKGSSGGNRFFRFIFSAPVRRLILTVIFLGLIIWHWTTITNWVDSVWAGTTDLFGWGLFFFFLALGFIIGVVWGRRVLSFIYHWNQWLGAVAFIFVVWGILAFFEMGGSFGDGIVGDDGLGGVFRLLGLVLLGIILIAPGFCWRQLKRFLGWVGIQLRKRPSPEATYAEPPSLDRPMEPSVITQPPLTRPPDAEATTPVVTPAAGAALTPTPGQQELRQVAQEVWKKYGESPALVTVDGWRLPPIDILDNVPDVEFGQADNMQRARLIEEALASYGVAAKVVQINAGPTVTQFGVEPGWDRKMKEVKERDKDGNIKIRQEEVSKTRVKVERINSLSNDLALALAAPSIRIEAPVPGKSLVGIEVPNTIYGLVSLRGVVETNVFQKLKPKAKLSLALGKGAGGEAVAADLSRMPHLLIAGATGSGKTVCLNSIVCCLLLHYTPTDVRFIMVDPKRVELTPFNSIPHLAVPVIVDTNKALGTLRWLNQEMDKRYQKLAADGARNVEGYNKSRQGDEKLPYLVLVIDELADLMMAGFDEVEHVLCRLAQLARATGIHLIVATQRPSVDVVTGLIKANFPTRISFAVTSQVDSRTILDMGGAEKLLGRGDMLYMPTEAAKPKRLQGCYVSDAERERLVYFWGSQQKEEALPLKIEEIVATAPGGGTYPPDPLLEAARQLGREHKHISTSFLQRRLRIGYPRAARIMDQLEEEGIKRGGEEV